MRASSQMETTAPQGSFAPDAVILHSADPESDANFEQVIRLALSLCPEREPGFCRTWADCLAAARTLQLIPTSLEEAQQDQTLSRGEIFEILHRSADGQEPINEIGEIPDVTEDDPFAGAIYSFYRAGLWAGEDEYGTFCPDEPLTGEQLQTLADRLTGARQRLTFTLRKPKSEETILYGYSGAGRELNAYRFGEGENVLVLTFAIHGWEDNWNRDGAMLVHTAELLMEALDEHYDLIEEKNWTVYVLPCLNPDGLYDGWTCDGAGRATTWRLDAYGDPEEGSIDMNRCFPYLFRTYYGSRNYNGTAPLQASEAKALADFTIDVMGEGNNVLIDAHGWYSQIIVSGGWGCAIHEALSDWFPNCYYTSLYGSRGYYSAWASYVLGYDGALFEFPNVGSEERFLEYGYDQDYVNAILELLEIYE